MVFRGLLHWRETRPGERPRAGGVATGAKKRTHALPKTGFSIIDFRIQSDLDVQRLGDIAQLVERLLSMREVMSSILYAKYA